MKQKIILSFLCLLSLLVFVSAQDYQPHLKEMKGMLHLVMLLMFYIQMEQV